MRPKPARIHTTKHDGSHESDLAWDLVEQHRTNFSKPQLTEIFLRLGCREFAAVIETVLGSIAQSRRPLSEELAGRVLSWLHGYQGHASQAHFRDLVDRCRLESAPRHERYS